MAATRFGVGVLIYSFPGCASRTGANGWHPVGMAKADRHPFYKKLKELLAEADDHHLVLFQVHGFFELGL